MSQHIPHINLSGLPGAGKSTIAELLLEHYNTILIPKFTTRPQRPHGELKGEYIFVDQQVFNEKRGNFLRVESIDGGMVGIPNKTFWLRPTQNTELILSLFGEYAPEVKRQIAPEMTTIFISCSNTDTLVQRLRHRCSQDGSDIVSKKQKIREYTEKCIWTEYDYVLYNDYPPENVLSYIKDIIGYLKQ